MVDKKVNDFFLKKGLEIQSDENLSQYNYIEQLDSIQIVEMIADFEDEFNIQFNNEDMESDEFKTIGGLISIIKSKIS